jgi:hypothetical protein
VIKVGKTWDWYVQEDVRLVRNQARFVIEIDEKEKVKPVTVNDIWNLNVVAVIGPGIDEKGGKFKEAVLFELGIFRMHPYRGINPDRKGRIHKRRNSFFLSKNQYLAIRPLFLDLIRTLAKEKIAGRKRKVQIIFMKKVSFDDYDKRTRIINEPVAVLTGVRFSMSACDNYPMSDILNLELKNIAVVNKLENIARLSNYSLEGMNEANMHQKSFSRTEMDKLIDSKLNRIKSIADMISLNKDSFMAHHYSFLFLSVLISDRNLFLRVVSHVLDLNSLEFESEIKETMGMLKLIEQESYPDIQVRSIAKSSKKGKYLVFEVAIPSLISPEEISKAEERIEEIKWQRIEWKKKKNATVSRISASDLDTDWIVEEN